MKILNLTPHDVAIQTQNGRVVIPASGQVARLTPREEEAGTIDVSAGEDSVAVPVVRRQFGEPIGLPEPSTDTIYIVSALVLEAVGASRPDLVAPDTGATAIRDGDGRIVAVTRFVTAATMKLKNLTAYDVTIISPDGPVTIPYSGLVAEPGRIGYDVEMISVGRTQIPVVRARRYGPLEVPPPEEGTLYIVPRDVYAIYGASRPDFVTPDTGPTAIRDSNGRVTAVRQLLGGVAEALAEGLNE